MALPKTRRSNPLLGVWNMVKSVRVYVRQCTPAGDETVLADGILGLMKEFMAFYHSAEVPVLPGTVPPVPRGWHPPLSREGLRQA